MIRWTNVHEIYGNVVNAELFLPTYANVGNAVNGNVENVPIGAPSVHPVGRKSILFVLIVITRTANCWSVMRRRGVANGAVQHDFLTGTTNGPVVIKASVSRRCYFAGVPCNIDCSVCWKHQWTEQEMIKKTSK